MSVPSCEVTYNFSWVLCRVRVCKHDNNRAAGGGGGLARGLGLTSIVEDIF